MTDEAEQPPAAATEMDSPHETIQVDVEASSTDKETADGHPAKPAARIRYRIEWCHRLTGEVLDHKDSDEPLLEPGALDDEKKEEDGPIFDVVTRFTARSADSDAPSTTSAAPGSAATRSLRIYSIAIINALQAVVKYYPGQDLSGNMVEINWPYPILVHHYQELAEFKDSCGQKSPEQLCVRERDAVQHIECLLKFLDDNIMESVREEEEHNREGNQTFDQFWLAYRPGSTVMTKVRNSEYWEAFVVHSVNGGTFASPPVSWEVKGWVLDYDGTYIGRKVHEIEMDRYDGANSFQQHTRFFPDRENIEDEDAKELIGWGELYWSFINNECRYHEGKAMTFPHNQIEGQVVTDLDNYYTTFPNDRPILMDNTDCRKGMSDCLCGVCKQRPKEVESIFESYNLIPPRDSREVWGSPHKYLLMPHAIQAFVFKTRTWERLHVKNIRNAGFTNYMMESLVMPEARVKTLKALAKSFIRENAREERIETQPWSADFVKGKGTGLIFLLHGSPGVGKTYTAEAIAEYTKRPLMVLASSDIGTDPATVELNLEKNFKTAKSWGAVLLIDEADVFMEKRKSSDLVRNSLVAGFLRALEYYDGILFLTTNRVGLFDDAFISRIHIQLYYPEFTDVERQRVWKTFIDKLTRERGKTMRVTVDAKDYIRGKEVTAVKWNGREIRNAFQTAVCLAEYANERDEDDKIKLTDEHLREVLELSQDFKAYLYKLHKGDEAKRAQLAKERAVE